MSGPISPCTADEIKLLSTFVCPDCGSHRSFLAGPRGALCQNIQCGECGSEFNVGPRVGGSVFFAERIGERSPKLATKNEVQRQNGHP